MSAATFASGDVVYTRDGVKCSYVSTAEDQHVVRPFQRYGDEEDLGDLRFVEEVRSTPPTDVLHAEIAELTQRAESLEEQIHQLEQSHRRATHESTALLARLKRHDALKHLEDFIEGRITHFVSVSWSGVEVRDRESALALDEDRYRRRQRLLSLYGDSNGDLSWQLNRYGDGSSSWEDRVIPCLSLDDARAKAADFCDRHYAAVRAKREHLNGSFLKSAAALGFPLPDDLVRVDREARLANEQRLLRDAEKSLADRRAALDAVLAEFPAEILAAAPESAGGA